MVQTSRQRLTRSLPALGGAGIGLIVALSFVILPDPMLEGLVEGSGIPSVMPVAAPPLGMTARAVLALGGGCFVAAVIWAALYLLFGPGGPLARKPRTVAEVRIAPAVRRADAHPDAPPRWPLSADELPVPPTPVVPRPVERAVPADLEMPLAMYDPDALPPVPMPPARVLAALAPAMLAPGERLETFTLSTPPPPPAPPPRPSEPPSIDSLLRRLEQGARRRTAGAH